MILQSLCKRLAVFLCIFSFNTWSWQSVFLSKCVWDDCDCNVLLGFVSDCSMPASMQHAHQTNQHKELQCIPGLRHKTCQGESNQIHCCPFPRGPKKGEPLLPRAARCLVDLSVGCSRSEHALRHLPQDTSDTGVSFRGGSTVPLILDMQNGRANRMPFVVAMLANAHVSMLHLIV